MLDPTEEDNRDPIGGAGNFVADLTDDDATILDSLVSSEAEPPETDELPIVRIDMRPLASKPIPAIQRFVARTISLPTYTPFLLARANPWRKFIKIEIDTNLGAQNKLYFASSPTEAANPLTSAGYAHTNYDSIEFAYNGELWAYFDSNITTITISTIEILENEAGR